MFGLAIATSGSTYGTYGQSDSTVGRGVYGRATATTGVNYGVYGENASTSRGSAGVFGRALGTGPVSGIEGRANTSVGNAIYAQNESLPAASASRRAGSSPSTARGPLSAAPACSASRRRWAATRLECARRPTRRRARACGRSRPTGTASTTRCTPRTPSPPAATRATSRACPASVGCTSPARSARAWAPSRSTTRSTRRTSTSTTRSSSRRT